MINKIVLFIVFLPMVISSMASNAMWDLFYESNVGEDVVVGFQWAISFFGIMFQIVYFAYLGRMLFV